MGQPRRWVQLRSTTNHSYLQGASHPKELVAAAADLGYAALAITDDGSLAGVAKAHVSAKQVGLPLILGARVELVDGPPLLLWAIHRQGYAHLARLISRGRGRTEKGRYELTLQDVQELGAGLIAALLPAGQTPSRLGRAGEQLAEALGRPVYLVADLSKGINDPALVERLRETSQRWKLPLILAPEVRCHDRRRKPLLDVMTAIRQGQPVAQLAGVGDCPTEESPLGSNAEAHLQPVDQRLALFQLVPEAYDPMLEIAAACQFSLDELRYDYPTELVPAGVSPMQHLRQLTWNGAADRYPQGVPDHVARTLEHELALIDELRYEAYFLTVHDIVRFARGQNILCQGRGSAANSAVCYCLHVTSVDPDQSDLLFERFVSRERNEPPDIDIDFEHQRREEVLQYLYEKYGRQRAGMTGVNISYCLRSAIRDVGKALGFSLDRIDALAKRVDRYAHDPDLPLRCRQVGIDPTGVSGRQLVSLVDELIGHPRHLSQHPGGMVLSETPLEEVVPIENAAMPGRSVIQWDKYDLDELGILKVDCLGLGIMSCLHRAFDLLRDKLGIEYDLASIPPDDTATYDMICRAETMGVFQIESRAQMATLPRLRPRCFYDLVIEIALIRPGPIQGQMVHPLLRRRAGLEQVSFPNKKVQRILGKTHGVPIFQEQVMRMAIELADFTPGEADALRKAMGAWRRDGDLTHFQTRLINGMLGNGLSREFAERVCRQIEGFGEYGFPESHATSFALLAYATAYLKCHYPGVYLTALLNSQPMGFYRPSQLIREAEGRGVEVRPADVSHSDWESTLENPHTVRLGLGLLKGMTEKAAEVIVQCRRQRAFGSFDDFDHRTELPTAIRRLLANADAFQSLGLSRRQALWQSLAAPVESARQPLLAGLANVAEDQDVSLPQQSALEEVLQDYARTGLSLKGHPIAFYRPALEEAGVLTCDQLSDTSQSMVEIAGLVIMRQRPGTAKGITFVTLEDETGQANLIVHPRTWKAYYEVCRCSPIWRVRGRLQRQEGIQHLIVQVVSDFSSGFDSAESVCRGLGKHHR